MDTVLKVFIYAMLGVAWIYSGVWYVRSVRRAFFGSAGSEIIAPFSVTGKTEPQYGSILAHMLQAKLASIRQEMEASARLLEGAGKIPTERRLALPVQPSRPLTMPDRVFEALNIDMKVAGVEVGGLISWLQRYLSKDDIIRFSAQFGGEKSVVVGDLNRDAGQTVWIEGDVKDDRALIETLAYTIAQDRFQQRIPESRALTVDEFRELLQTLRAIADLKVRVAAGRAFREDYEAPLESIANLSEKAPSWKALLRLGGELSENAFDLDQAIVFYEREAELAEGNEVDALRSKIVELSARNDVLLAVSRQRPRDVGPGGASRKSESVPPIAVGPDRTRSDEIRTMLGVVDLDMSGEPLVAIVGGLPPAEILAPGGYQVVGERKEAGGRNSSPVQVDEYTGTLVDLIRLIAPRTKFVFSPMEATSASSTDLLRTISNLVEAKPRVLLITFGPLEGIIWESTLKNISEKHGILVIHARPNLFAGAQTSPESVPADVVICVSGVDSKGETAEFSTTSNIDDFWAPAVDIPVAVSGGRFELRSGNSYAASLAAGITARLFAENADLKPERVREVLRATSDSVFKEGEKAGPKVLNLRRALEKVKKK